MAPFLPPHHALFALDHEPFVLVQAADAADHVLVLLVPVLLLADRGLAAVGFACRLSHDLIDLGGRLVPSAVIGLAEPAHVAPGRRFSAIIFLKRNKTKKQRNWIIFPRDSAFSVHSSCLHARFRCLSTNLVSPVHLLFAQQVCVSYR